MAQMKTTPKNLVIKKKSKRHRGRDVQVPQKTPWEVKGWIGLIKALKLIVNEQLRHVLFCFFLQTSETNHGK